MSLKYNRARLFLSGLLAVVSTVSALADGTLWVGPSLPNSVVDLPFIDTATCVPVHQAIQGEDQFLLGSAIVEHNGVFYANWANSPFDENSDAERVCGKQSIDGGRTWSELDIVAPSHPGELARSHGAYLTHKGELWFFALQFNYTAAGRQVNTEAFVLNENSGQWESRGIVAHGGGMVDAPVRMKNGNWIAGGVYTGFWACVFISHGDDFTRWDRVPIPVPKGEKCSETTVLVDDEQITAVMRSSFPDVAGVSISQNFGRSWSLAEESNFPMVRSKPFGGMLSNGQRYLIANISNGNPLDRDMLALAVSSPGARGFSRMWKIRQGRTPQPRFEGKHKVPGWQYPYAYEYDGALYVIYAVGKEDCELVRIPIADLSATAPPAWVSSKDRAAFQPGESSEGLIVYEGFGYSGDGSVAGHPLSGEPAGEGFYGKWNVDRNSVELSAEHNRLVFPSGTSFESVGRGVVARGANGTSAKARRVLSGAGLSLDVDQEFYVSALLRKTDHGVARGEYLQILFYAENQKTPFWMGIGSREQAQMGTFGESSIIFSGPYVGAEKTVFLVAKVAARETGEDRICLKAFSARDRISNEPKSWDIAEDLPLRGTVHSIILAFGPNSFGEVDELRIGRTWQSVTGTE